MQQIEGDRAEQIQKAREMLAIKSSEFNIIYSDDSRRMSELPPEVFTFTDLTALDLGRNKLTEFNATPGVFPLLTQLYLGGNNALRTFKVAEGAFQSLQILKLSLCRLPVFNVSGEVYPSLQTLHLNYNKMTSFSAVGVFPIASRAIFAS